jgi:hypothetical protein
MVAKYTLIPCSGKISCFRGGQCTMAHRGRGFRNTWTFAALPMSGLGERDEQDGRGALFVCLRNLHEVFLLFWTPKVLSQNQAENMKPLLIMLRSGASAYQDDQGCERRSIAPPWWDAPLWCHFLYPMIWRLCYFLFFCTEPEFCSRPQTQTCKRIAQEIEKGSEQ